MNRPLRNTAPPLTQERLQSVLHYNPDTGVFTRLVATAKCLNVGDIAGSPDGQGYPAIMVDGVVYKAHRLAFLYMLGGFPEQDCDHINGVRDDNRWSNLRLATRSENNKNARLRRDNKSGITGVGWHKLTGRWLAHIRTNGKSLHLGTFDDWFDAVCARKSMEVKLGFHANHGRIV